MSGLVFEQRAYIISLTYHEVCQEKESNKLLLEAEYWLFEYAKNKIIPEKPQLKSWIEFADKPYMREKLIQFLMSWTPKWDTILNSHFGHKFIAGNNELEIIGFYQEPSDKTRKGVRVLCEVCESLNKDPNLPVFPKGDICLLGTFQIESLIGERLI